MIHQQEKVISQIEEKFRKEYPSAARALEGMMRKWNETPTGAPYFTRWHTEHGQGVDNGSFPASEVYGELDLHNYAREVTERFDFVKEHDWTWVDVQMEATVRLTTAPASYPHQNAITFLLGMTAPGNYDDPSIPITASSPGAEVWIGNLTFVGTDMTENIYARQLLMAYPYDWNYYNDVSGAGYDSAPRGFPKGRYSCELNARPWYTSTEKMTVNRVRVWMQEVKPHPEVGDPEALIP